MEPHSLTMLRKAACGGARRPRRAAEAGRRWSRDLHAEPVGIGFSASHFGDLHQKRSAGPIGRYGKAGKFRSVPRKRLEPFQIMSAYRFEAELPFKNGNGRNVWLTGLVPTSHCGPWPNHEILTHLRFDVSGCIVFRTEAILDLRHGKFDPDLGWITKNGFWFDLFEKKPECIQADGFALAVSRPWAHKCL